MTRAIQLRFNSDLIPTCYFWFTSLLLTRFISHDRVLVEIAGACDRVLLSKSPPRSSSGLGLSKTEVNLKRLLASAPHQDNLTKLIHYITTLREQLELLGAETTPDGVPRVSKAKLKEYSDKIESLAGKLAAPAHDQSEDLRAVDEIKEEKPSSTEHVGSDGNSAGLRRRTTSRTEDRSRQTNETDTSAPVRLDETARTHIEKHRKLQEDLTDEMVVLARQLKESSLLMNQSLHDTEKILDSTEKAVEHSLATTNRANTRATEVYSLSSKTTCFTWLLMFVMTCMFIMVVLLIRVT